MTQKATIAIIVVAVVLVVGYFIFSGIQRPAPVPEVIIPTEQELPTEQEFLTEEEPLTSEVREIAVSGTEFSFNPNSLTLKQGERVRVVFTNTGSLPHDFVIEGLGIKTKVIGAGETDTIEFTVPASVNYSFYCSVPGHREAGMEGSIRIE